MGLHGYSLVMPHLGQTAARLREEPTLFQSTCIVCARDQALDRNRMVNVWLVDQSSWMYCMPSGGVR
eukprot:137532-Amphidinium_carterae.1